MLTFTFGKTKVRVDVEGCVGCGTRWSWKWGVEKEVTVQVGQQRAVASLPKCGDCLARGEQLKMNSLIEQTADAGR